LPDVRVSRGTTAKLDRIDGELYVERGARITAADGKLVTVSQAARFQGDADIACDLACDSLSVQMGELKVAGDLTVAKGIDIAHSLRATGTVKAEEIQVGGKLIAGAVSCETRVGVGGYVEVARTLEAGTIDVGGKVKVSGAVRLNNLIVGGMVEVGGGALSGKGQVGGVFESTGPLEFGELQVYGRCRLPSGCKGGRISTSGKLSILGDLDCDDIEVGGVADIEGNCRSGKVRINGKLDVEGSLSTTGSLDNFGSSEVKGDFSGGELHVSGRFKARKVLVDQAEVAGEVETAQGMKARSVIVGSGSKIRGPVVGGRVELSKSRLVLGDWNANWMGQVLSMRLVGRMTYAEDVYGDEVILGPATRCRNIYAKVVELGQGSIADKVTYTDELKQGHNLVHLERPSDKVEKLPPFPL